MDSGRDLLQFVNVEFDYDDMSSTPLIVGFDARIEKSEFVAILGPSGCGKSTLLSLAAGLLLPHAGQVVYRGEQLQSVNTDAGYMTQNDTLLPWRTTAKNVRLPLEFKGRNGRNAWHEQVVSETSRVGLKADVLDKYPAELSGGMKRRAILARTLISQPRLLLMDEPFAALDAQLRAVIHVDFRATTESTGQTVLFVTHDVEESILLADRILVVGGHPLSIIHEVSSPFPAIDRDVLSIREDPKFPALQGELWRALGEAKITA